MNKELLPIGSVVLLKEGEKRLMITGYYSISEDSPDKIYDYCGCLYPEGVISSEEIYVFDHAQIDKISFTGYIDEEEKAFKINLAEAVKEMNNKKEEVQNEFLIENNMEEIERL